MRVVARTILVIATMLAASSAEAQRYDPHYPVCLQTYSRGGSAMLCQYSSMAQCRATASGIAAQCLANPYYGHALRRHYRTY
jgi:Protein of unknown function (DUF3551)